MNKVTFTGTGFTTRVPHGGKTPVGEYRGVRGTVYGTPTDNEVVIEWADGLPAAMVDDNARVKLMFTGTVEGNESLLTAHYDDNYT